VGDDSDVADVTERRCTGHVKVPLISEGWVGETPSLGVFRGANGSEKWGNLLEKFEELADL
jgi:hypothetical protein